MQAFISFMCLYSATLLVLNFFPFFENAIIVDIVKENCEIPRDWIEKHCVGKDRSSNLRFTSLTCSILKVYLVY